MGQGDILEFSKNGAVESHRPPNCAFNFIVCELSQAWFGIEHHLEALPDASLLAFTKLWLGDRSALLDEFAVLVLARAVKLDNIVDMARSLSAVRFGIDGPKRFYDKNRPQPDPEELLSIVATVRHKLALVVYTPLPHSIAASIRPHAQRREVARVTRAARRRDSPVTCVRCHGRSLTASALTFTALLDSPSMPPSFFKKTSVRTPSLSRPCMSSTTSFSLELCALHSIDVDSATLSSPRSHVPHQPRDSRRDALHRRLVSR
jgi:hypothetical protein